MSDTQFSSLSPNSSNDFEVGNHCSEEAEFSDQETLSITSNKSVPNLVELCGVETYKTKGDPFLSDFMKEENDDAVKLPTWYDTCTETNEMNVFFSLENTENDFDNFLSVGPDCLDSVVPDLLEWDSVSPPTNLFSAQKQSLPVISSKRAFSPTGNLNRHDTNLMIKQRRVEVSSHVICDEWINKYHDKRDNISLKASGMLDRRKTKHHKILSEFDPEQQFDSKDSKRGRAALHVHKRYTSLQNHLPELSNQKPSSPLSISTLTHKYPIIRAISINRDTNKRPIIHCSNSWSDKTKLHITTERSHNYQPSSEISSTHSPGDLSSTGTSAALSDILEMPRIPAPLRMGKRVGRRGHRLSLWQYLMYLLDSTKYKEQCTGIRWISRNNGVFHITDSKQVATLWGEYKERRDKMTYDSLARSLRHYYKKKLMAKINNRRLVYQIAQECIQWSAETFLQRKRE